MGLPELRLPPGNTIHQDISGPPDRQADRPARLVALILILVIPSLTVPKEKRLPMTQQLDVRATEPPGGTPLSVSDVNTVPEPVLNVSAPFKAAKKVNFDVAEGEGIHDLADVPVTLSKGNGGVGLASLEDVEDTRSVIGWP